MPCLILRIYLCFLQITCTESQSTILQHQDYQTTLNKFYLETRPTQSINLENFKLSLWFRQTKISDSMKNEILTIKCNNKKMAEEDDHHMNLVTIQEQQTLIKIIYLDDENTKQQCTTSLHQYENNWIQLQINGLSSQEQIYFKIRLHSVEQNIEFTFQSSQSQLQQPSVEFSSQLYDYQKIRISEFSELQSNECAPGCLVCDSLNPFICLSCNQYEQRKQANCECLENKYQYDGICISQLRIMQKYAIFTPRIQIYEFTIKEGKYVHNGSIYQDCQGFLTEQTLALVSLNINWIEFKITFTNQITNWICESPVFRIKLLLQQEDNQKQYLPTVLNSSLAANYISINFSCYYFFIATDLSIFAEMIQLNGLRLEKNTQKLQIYFGILLTAQQVTIQIYNMMFINAIIDYSLFTIDKISKITIYIDNFTIFQSNLTKFEYLFAVNSNIIQSRTDINHLIINKSLIYEYSLCQYYENKFVINSTIILDSKITRTTLFSAAQIVSYDLLIFKTQFESSSLYSSVKQLQISEHSLNDVIFHGSDASLIQSDVMNNVVVISNVILSYLKIFELGGSSLIIIHQSLGVLIRNFTILQTRCMNKLLTIQAEKIVIQEFIFGEMVLYDYYLESPGIINLQATSTRINKMSFVNLYIHGSRFLIYFKYTQTTKVKFRNVIVKNLTLTHFINYESTNESIILFENINVQVNIAQSTTNEKVSLVRLKCSQIIIKNSKFEFNHKLNETINIFAFRTAQVLFERSVFLLNIQPIRQYILFFLKATQITLNQCTFSQINIIAQSLNISESWITIMNSQIIWNTFLSNTKDISSIDLREFLKVDLLNNHFYVESKFQQIIFLSENIRISLINNYFKVVSQNVLFALLDPISELYIKNNSITGIIFQGPILDCQIYCSITILNGKTVLIDNLSQTRFNASLLNINQFISFQLINIQVNFVFYTNPLLEIQSSIEHNTVIINNVSLKGIHKQPKCLNWDFQQFVNLITLINHYALNISMNNVQIVWSSNQGSMISVRLMENQAFQINNIFLYSNLCLTVCLIVVFDPIIDSRSLSSINQVYFLRNLGSKMIVITSHQKILLTNVAMNNQVLFYTAQTSQAIEVQNVEIYEYQIDSRKELLQKIETNKQNLIKITYNSDKRLSYFINNYGSLARIIEVSFDDGITYYRNKILNSEQIQLQVQFYHKGVEKAYMYIPPYGYSMTNYSKFDYYHSVYNNYRISLRYKAAHSLKSSIFCASFINETLQNYFNIENQDQSQLIIQYYEPYIIEFNVKCQDNDTVNSSILSLSFYAKQLHCQIGEINFKNKCIPCLKKFNQYSLAKNARYCKTFDNRTMQSAELCFITLRQGFWRADYKTDLIESCLLQLQTCNGGSNYGDQSCMQGYIGALCFECDSYNLNGYGNYYRGFNGSCSQDQYSLLALMSLAFYIILLLFVVHISVQIYQQYEMNRKQFYIFCYKYVHIVIKHKVNSLFVYIVFLFSYLQISSLFHDRFTNKILTITQQIGLLMSLTNYSPLLIIDNLFAPLFQMNEFIYLRILLCSCFWIIIYNLYIINLLCQGDYKFQNIKLSLFYFSQIIMTNYQKMLIELTPYIVFSNKTYIYSNVQFPVIVNNYANILVFAIPQLAVIFLINSVYLLPKTSGLILKLKFPIWILELRSYLFKVDVYYINAIYLHYVIIQIMILAMLIQFVYVRLFMCILLNQIFLIVIRKTKPYFRGEFNQYLELISFSLALQVIIQSLINILQEIVLLNILSHAQDLVVLCSVIGLLLPIIRHLEKKPIVQQLYCRSRNLITCEQKVSLVLKFKFITKQIIYKYRKTQITTILN